MISIQRPVVIQTAAAVTALFVGVFVYSLDRQPERVYFMSPWMALGDNIHFNFGTIRDQLPTFFHGYAFILLTIVVVSSSREHILPVSIFWFIIDSIFEIAQFTLIAQGIANYVPDWFRGIPFLENTAAYFLGGTFDIFDLCSIAAGTLAAYLTIVISTRRISNNV